MPCDLTRAGLASVGDGDVALLAGHHRIHVPPVRRADVLGAGEQEAIAVLRPTQLREPCDVGPGGRTRIRNQVQYAAPAGVRTCMAGAFARCAGRGARALLPHLRALPRLVRGRRGWRARFRSAAASAGSTSRRRPARGCRPSADAQARPQPAEPARRQPTAAGGPAGAAPRTGRLRPPIADPSIPHDRRAGRDSGDHLIRVMLADRGAWEPWGEGSVRSTSA